MYERNSNRPPSCLGGVVGQKENSCMSEVCLWVMSCFSFLSNAGKSEWCCIECREAW